MAHRALRRVNALLVAVALATLVLVAPTSAQGTRKENPASKSLQGSAFASIPIGGTATYRVTLKGGRRFVTANGDGLVITTTGGVTNTDTRIVSSTVAEADFTSAPGQTGSATITINFTTKKQKLAFTKGGITAGGNEMITIAAPTKVIADRVSVGSAPVGIGIAGPVTTTSNRAFICNSGAGTVSVVENTTGNVIATVPVGTDPRYAAVAGAIGNQLVCVTNFGSDSVTIIDAETLNVIQTIAVGDGPIGIAFTGQAGQVQAGYVANFNSDTVSVIDIQTFSVTDTIPVADGPTGIAMAGVVGQQTAVVTAANANAAVFVSTITKTVVGQTTVGTRPVWVAVGGATFEQIFVVNAGSNSLSFLGLNRQLIATVSNVGSNPSGVTVVGPTTGLEAWVTNKGDGTVTVINVPSRQKTSTIPIGGQPRAATVISAVGSQKVLVTN